MTRSQILLLALALLLAAAPATAAQAAPPQRYLVSLGDSYATGYQATGLGAGHNTRNGFAYQVPQLAAARGYHLKLVNFGCGGATTSSLLEQTAACGGKALGGPRYSGTQIAAAARFLRRHRGAVDLITVSIGGNDVTACARAADPIPCVAAAVGQIERNVARTAKRLRRAGGAKPRIVGITYPDVILGQWVGAGADQELAKLSVVAFKNLINPTLEKAYAAGRGRLVDVTEATGAYGSLEETTTLAPYGVIPVPVAKVRELSYYCEFRDIHARTNGYRLIAELIVATLPRRR
jgi:lysophospholipase L1-like esterase